MSNLNPIPPFSSPSPSSSSQTPSPSPSKQSIRLTSTLSKLSQANSRPHIPHTPDQELSGQTMKLGKEVWRRTGLGSLWRSGEAEAQAQAQAEPESATAGSNTGDAATSSRQSLDSGSSLLSKTRFRTQALDTSSILYPTLSIHPPPITHNILVLSLSHVSSAPPTLSNDELLNILLRRLEPWVGELGEGGYVLVILADEDGDGDAKGKGKDRRKLPGIAWWVWKWKRLPRKYRKNLKRLYIVHPSLFTRTLLPFIVPFISPKSYSKLHPLPSLLSLYHMHQVPLKGLDVTLPVLEEEARVLRDNPDLIPPSSGRDRPKLERATTDASLTSWGYQAISSAVNTAASYLPLSPFGLVDGQDDQESRTSRGYWGRDLAELLGESGDIPKLLVDLRKVILAECTTTEGVFRRTSNSPLLTPLIALLDLPTDEQPNLPWTEIARDDPLLPPKVLGRFLGELKGPVIGPELYDVVRGVRTAEDIKTTFIPSLPPASATLLRYLTHMFHHLSLHSDATRMTALNLAIVLAPVLISGPDPVQDTIMCLAPGKPLPAGLRSMLGARRGSGAQAAQGSEGEEVEGTIVGLLEMWIKDWAVISSDATGGQDGGGCQCPWARSRSTDGRRYSSTSTSESSDVPQTQRRKGSGVRHTLLNAGAGAGERRASKSHSLSTISSSTSKASLSSS